MEGAEGGVGVLRTLVERLACDAWAPLTGSSSTCIVRTVRVALFGALEVVEAATALEESSSARLALSEGIADNCLAGTFAIGSAVDFSDPSDDSILATSSVPCVEIFSGERRDSKSPSSSLSAQSEVLSRAGIGCLNRCRRESIAFGVLGNEGGIAIKCLTFDKKGVNVVLEGGTHF